MKHLGVAVLAVSSSIGCRSADKPADPVPATQTHPSAPPVAPATAALAPSAPADGAPPSAPRAQGYAPANANPPFPTDPKEEPLGATRDGWIDFVARAARHRGKEPDVAAVRAAFNAPIRTLGDEAPTLWGKLCPELGLADEDGLDVLCQDGVPWAPTLVVADINGDGTTDYALFGTWTVAAHQDALLALFSQDGDRIRRVPIPDVPPFESEAAISHFGRPFLIEEAGGIFIHSQDIQRWNRKGEEVGHSPMEEAARRRDTVRVYRFEGFLPRLTETRIEDWDAIKGKRTKTIPAPARPAHP